MCLLVTYLPSFPANGLSFTINVISTLGSLILTKGIGPISGVSLIVSPIVISGIPAIQTMSPAVPVSIASRLSPSKLKMLTHLPVYDFASSK